MLVGFDVWFNDNLVGMFSSMKCLFSREINSISCSDEENAVDFDILVSDFRGDISDENMNCRCNIEFYRLNIDLTSSTPMDELNE